MGKSIEATFRGKEEQILAEIDRDSMKPVMKRYGLRNPYTFAHWIERHRDPDLSKLAGMEGGEKRLFYRKHRETIIDCLEIFGEAFVMENFHVCREDTLEGIIRGLNEPFSRKLTKADRMELKANEALGAIKDIQQRLDRIETRLDIQDADIADDRGKINELISFVKDFSHNVSETVARVLVQPLIQRTIQDGCEGMELPIKDPLELDIATDYESEIKPQVELEKKPKPGNLEPDNAKLKEIYMLAHPMSKED